MALCVALDGTALQVVGDYTTACAGYALMTAQEYASTPTLAALFATPEPEQVRQAFMAGLSLPLILWLTAWGFGVVVKFLTARTDSLETLDD
ncbi:hypothetical protein D9M68_226400 [compost metagenome]